MSIRNKIGAILVASLLSFAAYADGIDNPGSGSGGGGSGTVTSVSVTTANGVSGSVATATTTPAITLTLGAITPTTTAIGAGSAITSSGPGGALTALGFTTPGTGVATALGVNVGSAGAPVLFNGAGGTPSSLTLTNATGLPLSTGVTGTLAAAQEPAHTGDVTNSAGSLALTIANNAVTLAKLATQATNTVLGNATSGTAVPTALTMTSCSTASSAVIWTTNTGFGCNTSITANAVAVGGITGLGTGVATALAINAGSAGSVVSSGANPSGTAGPAAVNGSALTFMRSDGAPAIQSATTGQKGLYQIGATTNVIGPTAPGGTTSTTQVMMGLGGSSYTITPTFTGRVAFTISGAATNSLSAQGTRGVLRYGTGTAPVNGAAQTGTAVTNTQPLFIDAGAIGYYTSFTVHGVATGLTPGTAYWFDLALFVDSGTGSVVFLTGNAVEL